MPSPAAPPEPPGPSILVPISPVSPASSGPLAHPLVSAPITSSVSPLVLPSSGSAELPTVPILLNSSDSPKAKATPASTELPSGSVQPTDILEINSASHVPSLPSAGPMTNSSNPSPSAPKSSWVSILAETDGPNIQPPANVKVSKGVVRTTLPSDLLKDQPPLWSKYIAGHFIGDVAPHIGKVHATVNRLWTTQAKKTKIDAQFISSKVVLFKIEDENMKRRVLQRHFWHIADIPMIVQEWSPSNAGKSPDLSSIPLWVDFINVPDVLFSKKGLLFLGNLVGKAQKLHPSTERCTRFDVARVLVEVNLNSDPPSMIKLDGVTEISISIAYPWLPPRCSKCKLWGHKVAECETMNGNPLASSEPVTRPSPDKGLVAAPFQAGKNKDVESAITLPVVLNSPMQANVPSKALNVPDQENSPPIVLVPDLELVPVLAHSPVQATDPVPNNASEQDLSLTLKNNPVQSMSPSPMNETTELATSPELISMNQMEQSWIPVSKAKGSPARTIMTRGKCVASGEYHASRYQILENEATNLDDIEDGEIQSTQSVDSLLDVVAPAPVNEDQTVSQTDESITNKETKPYDTRRKENNKGTRQNHKSKKPSSRKA